MCFVRKYELTGLEEEFDKETILTIKPVADNATVKPLNTFIQSYNSNQFLVMVFAGQNKQYKEYCHYNGTEKEIETLSLPEQFEIRQKKFHYKGNTWIQTTTEAT